MRKDDTDSGTSFWMILATIATVVWMCAGIGLRWIAHVPNDCQGTPFTCMTIDEWGTYLSGIVAPVAFLWLVVSVRIQSVELRQQRKELALTRQEFEHNRVVMQAQADEARNQARYIELQTSILKEQHEQRKIDAKAAEFDDLLTQLEGVFRAQLVRRKFLARVDPSARTSQLFNPVHDPIPDNRDEAISSFIRQLVDVLSTRNADYPETILDINMLSPATHAVELAEEAWRIADELQGTHWYQAQRIGLLNFVGAMRPLIDGAENRKLLRDLKVSNREYP